MARVFDDLEAETGRLELEVKSLRSRQQAGIVAPASDPFGWVSAFELTEEDLSKMKTAEILIPGLIISGHISVIAGQANSGKTSLMKKFIPEIIAKGKQVLYINADLASSDVTPFFEHAAQHAYRLLLPDMKGLTMEHIFEQLQDMILGRHDLNGSVFIFDTLKKCSDLMNKRGTAELFKLFRLLTGNGATVVTLGQTNKYLDTEGRPIFEGTNDIRNDTDELVYLLPSEDLDGSRVVTIDCTSMHTKKRVISEQWRDRTLNFDKRTGEITEIDYIDTGELEKERRHRARDGDLIFVASMYILENDCCNQGAIVTHVGGKTGQGVHAITRVLKEYNGTDWYARKTFQNGGEKQYSVNPETVLNSV